MGVTRAGLAAIAALVIADATYLATGTGTTAFASTQTTLVTEITDSGLERATSTMTRQMTTYANDTSQAVKAWSVTGTKTVAEVGWFDAASVGNMYARTKLSTTRSVVNGDTYTLTYKIIGAI